MNAKDANNISIKRLYPELTPEEAKRAEENLEGYLALAIRVYRRISQDPAQLAELQAALYQESSQNIAEEGRALTDYGA